MKIQNAKLNDRTVMAMRRMAAYFGRFPVKKYACKFNMSEQSVSRALTGKQYSHLNNIVKPYVQRMSCPETREKARAMCLAGIAYSVIAKELSISKSTVSLYCRDIERPNRVAHNRITSEEQLRRAEQRQKEAEARALEREQMRQKRLIEDNEAKLARKNARRGRMRLLKVEDVIFHRADIVLTQRAEFATRAKECGVSLGAFVPAIYGDTFSELNEKYPPVPKGMFKRKSERIRLDPLPLEFTNELLSMRRSDPVTWTYQALANFTNEKTGRNYRGGPISVMLINLDPTLRELDAKYKHVPVPRNKKSPPAQRERRVRASVPRKKKIAEIVPVKTFMVECVVCEKDFETSNLKLEVCSHDCGAVLRKYNQEHPEDAPECMA